MAINFSLSKLPWYSQIGAFLALGLAAVAVFWNWYARPAQESIDARRAQLAVVRADISRGQTTARRLPEFRQQVADLEAQLDRLRAVLPEEQDVADLLRRVQGMATQSNLTIRGFTPQAVARKQMHMEWPIGLKLEGRYHDLGAFLERVSKFPRIINVSDIRIHLIDAQAGNDTITVECTATTFVLIEPKPKPAAPGQAAPMATLEPQGYAYDAEGRRDPFVSLTRRGSDPAQSAASNRAPGLGGLNVGEVTLKGTMATRDGFVAILLGIDSRTYIARAGDKLLDGAIKTISDDGIVVVQRVNDPLSPRKQREVRKPLRQTEEAR